MDSVHYQKRSGGNHVFIYLGTRVGSGMTASTAPGVGLVGVGAGTATERVRNPTAVRKLLSFIAVGGVGDLDRFWRWW